VRAPRLDDAIELLGFIMQLGGETVDLAGQLIQPPQAAQPDGGWNGIVGALRHVDVVIGMDRLLGLIQPMAQDLVGAVGDDLVGVHVVAGACPGLEGIDHELVIPATVDNFLRRLDDGFAPFWFKQAEVHVDYGRGLLDNRHAPYESAIRPHAADRKV
jgi:hypothetical protein